MCGIAGVVRRDAGRPVDRGVLERMAAALEHRGPDGYGLARGRGIGLVSTRLAVVDVDGGWQPMRCPPGDEVIVYNGEVYNLEELREDLERRGERCRSRSDTEVVLRLLARDGIDGLSRLNGQFALALWQPRLRRLLLARDRFGVRPLYLAQGSGGDLAFASEVKALFAAGQVTPAPDPAGLDDAFTSWGARAPRTVFAGVEQLPPGGLLVWQDGRVLARRQWWTSDVGRQGPPATEEELEALLRDSVRLRLRADIPVGTYLSGGLDSSLITALAQEASPHPLRTFSVAFDDARYDESVHQERVAEALGTVHCCVRVRATDLPDAFARAVFHAETPLLRTAPAPMLLLAEATRSNGITVVATGEGADELFWGYDVFREVRLRRAAAADPRTEEALDDLYPHLDEGGRGTAWRRALVAAGPADDPLYSHQPRFAAAGLLRSLLSEAWSAAMHDDPSTERLRRELPAAYGGWDDTRRAAWLEMSTLLEPYLLASQGDRMAMAHGVEGRYPYLDHRVFEAARRLPDDDRLQTSPDGFVDKAVLRRIGARYLPAAAALRRKQPYRSPEVAPFLAPSAPGWVQEALSRSEVLSCGVFDPVLVERLVARCARSGGRSQREAMAFVGVLSTQLWWDQYLRGPAPVAEATGTPHACLDLDAPHGAASVGRE